MSETEGIKYPVISFNSDLIDIGTLKEGETKSLEFQFTNTGNADLIIDLVTSCKCTELDWPREAVPPGSMGVIKVVFDSTGFAGQNTKVVDIIANTNPIVVEARFKVNVVKP